MLSFCRNIRKLECMCGRSVVRPDRCGTRPGCGSGRFFRLFECSFHRGFGFEVKQRLLGRFLRAGVRRTGISNWFFSKEGWSHGEKDLAGQNATERVAVRHPWLSDLMQYEHAESSRSLKRLVALDRQRFSTMSRIFFSASTGMAYPWYMH